MTSGVRRILAVVGGAAVLVLAVACGGGNHTPIGTSTPTEQMPTVNTSPLQTPKMPSAVPGPQGGGAGGGGPAGGTSG